MGMLATDNVQERVGASMPRSLKIWLADYSRRNGTTMGAVIVTLVRGLYEASALSDLPPPEPPPAGDGHTLADSTSTGA